MKARIEVIEMSDGIQLRVVDENGGLQYICDSFRDNDHALINHLLVVEATQKSSIALGKRLEEARIEKERRE